MNKMVQWIRANKTAVVIGITTGVVANIIFTALSGIVSNYFNWNFIVTIAKTEVPLYQVTSTLISFLLGVIGLLLGIYERRRRMQGEHLRGSNTTQRSTNSGAGDAPSSDKNDYRQYMSDTLGGIGWRWYWNDYGAIIDLTPLCPKCRITLTVTDWGHTHVLKCNGCGFRKDIGRSFTSHQERTRGDIVHRARSGEWLSAIKAEG